MRLPGSSARIRAHSLLYLTSQNRPIRMQEGESKDQSGGSMQSQLWSAAQPLLTIVLCLQPVSISEKDVKEISCTLRSEPPPKRINQKGLLDIFSDCKHPPSQLVLPKTFLVCLQMQIYSLCPVVEMSDKQCNQIRRTLLNSKTWFLRQTQTPFFQRSPKCICQETFTTKFATVFYDYLISSSFFLFVCASPIWLSWFRRIKTHLV